MTARRVPVDAIPLAMLAMPPVTSGTAYHFEGAPVALNPGVTGVAADGWVQRGDDVFKYELTKVELIGDLLDGATPAVWWPQKAGDEAAAAQLALLSWVPDPTPKALVRSDFLDESITETWGTVCSNAAPPTAVLFTFLREPLGPSAIGWIIDGEAWPDPAGTIRSSAPMLLLKVTERWRCGDEQVDNLVGVIPAVVEGMAVACPTRPERPPVTRPPERPPERPPVLRGREALRDAIRINPVTAARGLKRTDVFIDEELSLVDMATRVNANVAIDRSS